MRNATNVMIVLNLLHQCPTSSLLVKVVYLDHESEFYEQVGGASDINEDVRVLSYIVVSLGITMSHLGMRVDVVLTYSTHHA